MIAALISFIALVGALYLMFYLGRRLGREEGMAEGKNIEALRHAFFHRPERRGHWEN